MKPDNETCATPLSSRAQLDRINTHNLALKALITAPRCSDLNPNPGPLSGLTISLKDNIDTQGVSTTAGASFWKDRVPKQDAVVVQRLISAGATLFGKANMTELAWGVRSQSSIGGQCRNPWNTNHIPGGSSGGSGASVAAGFCTASLGTDTGGSIRLPAAFNGVVGLRPTYGRVPNTGVLPLSESFDTVGPMARRVEDVARVFSVIAGYDPSDPTSVDKVVPDATDALAQGINGLVIGIPTNYYFDHCDQEVVNAVMAAAHLLEQHGAILKNVIIPNVNDAQDMAACMMFSEVCALYQERLHNEPDTILAEVRERMVHGLSFTGMDYANAVRFQRRWVRTVQHLYAQVDVLLAPVTTQTAPLIDDGQTLYEITKKLAENTYVGSLAGIPSMALPCGFGQDGLPIGMLLEAPWWEEGRLFQVGHTYQQHTHHHLAVPRLL